MTALPAQARHGPADSKVNGTGVVQTVAGEPCRPHRNPLSARDLQLFADTSVVVSGSGRVRQTLIVRCPYCRGSRHEHHAPVGATLVFRRCPATGGQYVVHSGVLP